MKRILIFSFAYEPVVGGAEVAVKEITNRIPEYEFDMVTRRFDKSHKEFERVGNVNVHRIDSSKLFFPINAYIYGKKLHLKNPYAEVWSLMAAYAGFATLFFKKKFPDVRYILTLQEGDPIGHIKRKTYFVSGLFKQIFTRADIVQVISNYLGDFARSEGYTGRIEVIPNGVSTEIFSKPLDAEKLHSLEERFEKKEGDIFIITTSRLVEKNGVGDIIESLKFLPDNIKLLIIGVGVLDRELKLKAKKLKSLEARIKFLGFIKYEEIPNYLHVSDIFIRPSLSEGMGNSFIEAMAAGLPVIATPVGGIVDFLKDRETGLFCEVKNPESIAKQVMFYIENPNLKNQIIENAKKMVQEKYEWDLVAKNMKERVF